MEGIHIRKGRHEDIPTLCRLLQDLFAIEAGFEADEEKQAKGLERLMKREDALVLVAVEGNRVIGMCTVQTLISTVRGGDVGLLEDLVVASSRRGQGGGTLLLERACGWSVERGLSRLQLLADRSNDAALDFYGKRGWLPTGFIALRRKGMIQ